MKMWIDWLLCSVFCRCKRLIGPRVLGHQNYTLNTGWGDLCGARSNSSKAHVRYKGAYFTDKSNKRKWACGIWFLSAHERIGGVGCHYQMISSEMSKKTRCISTSKFLAPKDWFNCNSDQWRHRNYCQNCPIRSLRHAFGSLALV